MSGNQTRKKADNVKDVVDPSSAQPDDDCRSLTRRSLNIGIVGTVVTAVAGGNVYLVGRRFGFWNSSMELSVKGPFEDRTKVPLDSSEKGLVEAKTLRVTRKARDAQAYAKVEVKFLFQGPEDPVRRVRLNVELVDSKGRVLGQNSVVCTDSRIVAKKSETLYPGLVASPINSESMKVQVNAGKLDAIEKINVAFNEV